MTRWRKALISAFIALSVGTQVLTNLAVGSVPEPASAGPVSSVVGVVNYGRWLVDSYAFYTGLNGLWRMFSPVHRYDWWWRVIATDPNGRARELSTPSDTGRVGLGSFFVDFRETKFLLNMWTRPPMQSAYLDHRCREEEHAGRMPTSVRLELDWRNILPPDQAAARGDHRGPQVQAYAMASRACTR